MLLESGADPEKLHLVTGRTALMTAACEGHDTIVQTLLDFGAKITPVDLQGRTARVLALLGSYMTVVNVIDNGTLALNPGT
jgi:ankyrin repeat protein